MPRPTDEDREHFHDLVPADPRVVVKPMFGNLGAFVNGNMFMALFGSDVGVKLGPELAEELRAAGGGPFGPEDRPMGGYVTLPTLDDAGRRAWVDAAFSYVEALPPKKPKK
jgi:hypothetical protein